MGTMRSWFAGLVLVGLVFLLGGCGVLAPFKERQQSIEGLERAKRHEAPKYAEDEYNKALQSHENAESLIVTNKKSSQNKQAKEAYLQAILASSEAYAIAIRTQIENILKGIDAEMKSWKEMGLDVLVPGVVRDITTLVGEAEALMKDPNQYEAAHKKALEAESLVEKAKNELDAQESKARDFFASIGKVFERAQKEKVHLVEREAYYKHHSTYTKGLRSLFDGRKYKQLNNEGTSLKEAVEALIAKVVGATKRIQQTLDDLLALQKEALQLKANRALKVEYDEAVANLEQLQEDFQRGRYEGLEAKATSFKGTWEVIINLTKQKAEQARQALEEARTKFNNAKNRNTELDEVEELQTNQDVKNIYEDVKKRKNNE